MDRSIMSCIRCRIQHMRPNECFFSLCLISEVSDSTSHPIKYSTFTKCIDRLSDQGLISRLAPGLYYRIDQEAPITVHDVLSFFTDEHRGVISGKWALYSKGLSSRPGVPIRVFSTNLFRQKLHISGPFEESITVERINIENLDGEMVSALEALDLVQSISMLDSCYYSACLEIIKNYALHHFSKPALQALFQQRNQIPLRIRNKTFASLAAVLKRFDVECDLKLHIGTKYDTSEVLRLFYPELEMEIGEQQTPSENDLQLKEEQYVFSGFDL